MILFVTARSNYPLSPQEIYELCYQDECLSYFDVCTALPEMVASGHMQQMDGERYEITEKGRIDGKLTEESLVYTVRQKAENAVTRFNRQLRRRSFVKTQIIPRDNGDLSVMLSLDDETGNLMTMELMAPSQKQANRLAKLFEKKAELLYTMTMSELLDNDDSQD